MTSRLFLLGDNIDTDQLAPGQYMKGGIEELARHCLEIARPGFAAEVSRGDILVAGRNFGAGSSREQAAEALLHLGVAGVVAQSFAGIFYRNAINLGLPVFTAVLPDDLVDGEPATLDIELAQLKRSTGTLTLDPLPDNILAILHDGGLIAHLKHRFAPTA
jgi:3-isopropylmalate/(R)-2-methylmalate dehydratase small subunit